MNKHKFIELVENPSSIRDKDADILTELARNYPYSSLVRTLLAKACQGTAEAKNKLATAAVYIPDRRVLKAVMEGRASSKPAAREPDSVNTTQSAGRQQAQTSEGTKDRPAKPATEAPQEAKAPLNTVDEQQDNLRKLREQQEHPGSSAKKAGPIPAEQKAGKSSIPAIPIKQLPERLQEILENKEEKEINDPKRLEQINMIDSFIQNSSNIARKYRSLGEENQEQSDLSSGQQFTPPDLATENLAQIMVRQGKTEKAIDIYEKLVLKYPQKKAYFATCIEKLKTS